MGGGTNGIDMGGGTTGIDMGGGTTGIDMGGGTNGIDMGGGTTGIDMGGGTNGIDMGGGTTGIDMGGGTNGIDMGGGTTGIDMGGGTNGIDMGGGTAGIYMGGGTNGIDMGGGTTGIDMGGGITGIDMGGGTTGIDMGGGTTGIDMGGGTAGIYTGAVNGWMSDEFAGHHVLTGPVDSVDRDNGMFSSLGQTVFAGDDMLADLAVGDYIAVYGTVSGPGFLYADSLGRLPHTYVDGASEVFLVGLPTSFDTGSASVEIGGIRIDYSASLSNGDHPSAGIVGFRGIRPNAGGDLITKSN